MANLDAGEVLAMMAPDHPGDAEELLAARAHTDAHPAFAAAPLELHPVVLEAEDRTVKRRVDLGGVDDAGHAVHGRAEPAPVEVGVAALAGARAGVVGAANVARELARPRLARRAYRRLAATAERHTQQQPY